MRLCDVITPYLFTNRVMRELLESLGSRSDKDWNLTGFWRALLQLLGVVLGVNFSQCFH